MLRAVLLVCACALLCEGALPPGFEDKLLCKPGECLRPRQGWKPMPGPRSASVECYHAETKEVNRPKVWGAKLKIALASLTEQGFHEKTCAETVAEVPKPIEDLVAKYNCSNIKTDIRGALAELEQKISDEEAAQVGECNKLRKSQQEIFNANTKHWKDERDFAFKETVDAAKLEIEEVRKVFKDQKATLVGAMDIANGTLNAAKAKVHPLRVAKAQALAAQMDANRAQKESKEHVARVKGLYGDAVQARREAQTEIKKLKDDEAERIFKKSTGAAEASQKTMVKECDSAYDEVDRMIAQTRKVITQLSEIWDRIKENCIPKENGSGFEAKKTEDGATALLEVGGSTKLRSSCAALHRRAEQVKATLDAKMVTLREARTEGGAMSLLEVSSGGDDPVGEMQKILTGRLAASQRAKEECYEVLQTATAGKVQKERDALDAIMAESAAEFQKAMTKVHAKWMPNVTAAVTKFQARKSDAVQAARGFTDAEMAHADAVASRDAASSAFNVTRDAISTWLPGATAKRDAEIQKIEKRVIKAKEDGEAKWREVSKVHKEELSKATELINTECEKQIESMGREKQLISRFKGGMLQAAKIKPPPAGPKPETLDCDKKITQGVCCSLDVAQCFACKAGFTTQREYCADGGRKNCEVAGCAACNPKCGKPVEKVKPIKVGCVEEQNAVDAVQAELKAQSELEATEASTQKKMSTTEATCNGEAFNCAETREEDKAKCVADKSQCLVNVDKIRLELTKVQEKIKQSKSAENNLDGRTAKRNKALDECLSRQQLPKKE